MEIDPFMSDSEYSVIKNDVIKRFDCTIQFSPFISQCLRSGSILQRNYRKTTMK